MARKFAPPKRRLQHRSDPILAPGLPPTRQGRLLITRAHVDAGREKRRPQVRRKGHDTLLPPLGRSRHLAVARQTHDEAIAIEVDIATPKGTDLAPSQSPMSREQNRRAMLITRCSVDARCDIDEARGDRHAKQRRRRLGAGEAESHANQRERRRDVRRQRRRGDLRRAPDSCPCSTPPRARRRGALPPRGK